MPQFYTPFPPLVLEPKEEISLEYQVKKLKLGAQEQNGPLEIYWTEIAADRYNAQRIEKRDEP